MSDLIIEINKKTRKVILNNIHIGNDHENLQENLVFQFDEFVDGQARLEYEINETKNYIILQKENETYTIPVQNVITIYQEQTKGKINFQLVVTEGTEEENIPVFKSNIFFLICRPSINAVTEAPEGYELWIEQANAKLNAMDEALTKVDNLDIDANKVGKVTSIIITKKDGTQETINVNDGVSLEYLWQGTSLGIKREDEQNYVFVNLKGDKGDKGEAGAIKMIIVNELPETGADDTIYLVPAEDTETGNNYDEYVYVNNAWEKLGGIQVQVNLKDYVKNTDYATNSVGGVLKINNYYGINVINGFLLGATKTYQQYQSTPDIIISKGTLENVITGKGLVSNTDYATGQTGGVIKKGNYLNLDNGKVYAETLTYELYSNSANTIFVGKGTLENVLTERIGTIDTILETLTVGGGVS